MDGRTTWILGNWKQNKLRGEASALAEGVAGGLAAALGSSQSVRVGVAPTYLAIANVAQHAGTDPHELQLLAQDCAAQDSGAFTGEVGPAMLQDAGVGTTIIGHSERRASYGDTNEVVAAKVRSALHGSLTVVLCVGETLEQRDSGEQKNVVISQLSAALNEVESEQLARIVVAYEPVWAIGTGRTATPQQAAEMHKSIRGWLQEQFGADGGGRSILYGGSVKPGNAAELLAAGDIDGFLVGGASLDASSFLDIVRAAAQAESR
jgi:triosephosphate isomerase